MGNAAFSFVRKTQSRFFCLSLGNVGESWMSVLNRMIIFLINFCYDRSWIGSSISKSSHLHPPLHSLTYKKDSCFDENVWIPPSPQCHHSLNDLIGRDPLSLCKHKGRLSTQLASHKFDFNKKHMGFKDKQNSFFQLHGVGLRPPLC